MNNIDYENRELVPMSQQIVELKDEHNGYLVVRGVYRQLNDLWEAYAFYLGKN